MTRYDYLLHISDPGEVTFYVIEKNCIDDWDFKKYDKYMIDGSGLNPFKVFSEMKKRLILEIKKNKPKVLMFAGNTERKHKLYSWFMDRNKDDLFKDYQIVNEAGVIYCYRLQEKS